MEKWVIIESRSESVGENMDCLVKTSLRWVILNGKGNDFNLSGNLEGGAYGAGIDCSMSFNSKLEWNFWGLSNKSFSWSNDERIFIAHETIARFRQLTKRKVIKAEQVRIDYKLQSRYGIKKLGLWSTFLSNIFSKFGSVRTDV